MISNSYFFGYWHNKKYYIDIKNLNKILTLKNQSLKLKNFIKKINKRDVAIHIRGKDFLNNILCFLIISNP